MSTEQNFACHEIARGSGFITFAEVDGSIHVAEWFGYDIRRVSVLSITAARRMYRECIASGYERVRSFTVGALYCGLASDKIPAALRAAAMAACRAS